MLPGDALQRRTENSMEAQAKVAIAPISFEKIQGDYEAKGIDITDVNGLHGSGDKPGHFEKWHASKSLPTHDEDGKHFRSSRIFYKQYQDDPEGGPAAPLFVNLWHYLLKISEPIPWIEGNSERSKTTPVAEFMLTVTKDIHDDDIDELRGRIDPEGELPDEIFAHHVNNLRILHRQETEARKLMLEIIDAYGTETPKYGKVVFMAMKVDC